MCIRFNLFFHISSSEAKGLPRPDAAFILGEFFIYLFYFISLLFHAFLYRRGCIHLSYTDTQYIVLISNSLSPFRVAVDIDRLSCFLHMAIYEINFDVKIYQ